MNFMPSEDAFYNEPLQDEVAPAVAQIDFSLILESSLRQEKLLERIVGELEIMTRRLLVVERTVPVTSPVTSPSSAAPSKPSRGNLVLPPGSRGGHIPAVIAVEKKPELSLAEESALREQSELEAIQRRRADEEVRLARIEAERMEREAQEEQKRLAEIKRIEEEMRLKEELER